MLLYFPTGPAVADRLIQDKKTQLSALELKYMDILKEKHAHVSLASCVFLLTAYNLKAVEFRITSIKLKTLLKFLTDVLFVAKHGLTFCKLVSCFELLFTFSVERKIPDTRRQAR